MAHPVDFKDQVIGSLMAKRYVNRGTWECICVCGNKIHVCTRKLMRREVTSCGCQEPPKGIAKQSPAETLRVLEYLDGYGVSGAAEIAEVLNLMVLSVSGVLRYLYTLGVVEKHRSSTTKNSLRWGLRVSLEDARTMVDDVFPTKERNARKRQELKEQRALAPKPVNIITEEDLEWMAHYRQRWISRYQRQGLPIPIRFD